MTESLFSPSWYRVAELKPRLRGHAQVRRHDYRGEVWYVMQDQTKGRFYRFPPSVYQLLGRMDGEHTVQELWEDAVEQLGDDGPTQTEVVQLMSQLHSADMIVCDVPPDTAELLRRSRKLERSRRLQTLRSPLAVRVPLFDPDRFLAATLPLVRPFVSPLGAVLWLAVVGTAAVLAVSHWTDLTSNAAWYLLDTSRARKPFTVVMRQAAQFLYRNAPTDPVVFDQHAVLYGAHERMTVAWSFPWLSSRSGV